MILNFLQFTILFLKFLNLLKKMSSFLFLFLLIPSIVQNHFSLSLPLTLILLSFLARIDIPLALLSFHCSNLNILLIEFGFEGFDLFLLKLGKSDHRKQLLYSLYLCDLELLFLFVHPFHSLCYLLEMSVQSFKLALELSHPCPDPLEPACQEGSSASAYLFLQLQGLHLWTQRALQLLEGVQVAQHRG